MVAVAQPSRTRLFAATVLNPVPVMVMLAPICALLGEKLVIVGNGTVKFPELTTLGPESTRRAMGPVTAPYGTLVTSCVPVAEVTVAVPWPLNETRLFVAVGSKPVPVMVTDVPSAPLVGEKLVIVIGTTVKFELAQPCSPPLTVTHKGPDVAAEGT